MSTDSSEDSSFWTDRTECLLRGTRASGLSMLTVKFSEEDEAWTYSSESSIDWKSTTATPDDEVGERLKISATLSCVLPNAFLYLLSWRFS